MKPPAFQTKIARATILVCWPISIGILFPPFHYYLPSNLATAVFIFLLVSPALFALLWELFHTSATGYLSLTLKLSSFNVAKLTVTLLGIQPLDGFPLAVGVTCAVDSMREGRSAYTQSGIVPSQEIVAGIVAVSMAIAPSVATKLGHDSSWEKLGMIAVISLIGEACSRLAKQRDQRQPQIAQRDFEQEEKGVIPGDGKARGDC